VYVFDRRALDHIALQGFQDIKEALIPRLHAAGESVAFHECARRSPRIFDATSYLSVNLWAVSRLSDPAGATDLATRGYKRREETFVHASARVSSRARLVGPVVVGPGAVIEDHATIVGPVTIGRESVVAQGAVVSRSVLWRHCRLGRGSLVDGCLVTDGALVPPRASRYRVLEAGRNGEHAPLHPGSWSLSRVRQWVQSALPQDGPSTRRPAHARSSSASVDRAVALGRSRS
jgi:NDP-sugar pyrophosphorylase family protein